MSERTNYTADVITVASQKNGYDEACKKLLSLKIIAAHILAAVVKEFKGFTIGEIIKCIGTPEISSVPVNADTPVIDLDNSEDSTVTEGKRFYDIKFPVAIPHSGSYIYLIINLEAQRKYQSDEYVFKRAVYYCARQISSQYGMVFEKSEYGKLRKVYSIWICTDPPEKKKNLIEKCEMHMVTIDDINGSEQNISDETDDERRCYDLINTVFLYLNDPTSDTIPQKGIIRMLSILFSDKLDAKTKIKMLETEYDIKMTEEIEEEVERMCNLSEGIWEKGIAEGMNIGMNKGLAEGMNRGLAEGMNRGLAEGMNRGLAEGMNRGRFEQLLENVSQMISKGMKFDDAIDLLDVAPDNALKIKKALEQ